MIRARTKRIVRAVYAFLCMGEITKPMQDEATKQGFWTDAGGRDFPKIQTLSFADLLTHQAKARYPAQDKASMLGYRAKPQTKQTDQAGLF